LLAAITRGLARWQMPALRHCGSRTVASHVHPDRHPLRRAGWKAQPSSLRGGGCSGRAPFGKAKPFPWADGRSRSASPKVTDVIWTSLGRRQSYSV
jgi:hypothetical protein